MVKSQQHPVAKSLFDLKEAPNFEKLTSDLNL